METADVAVIGAGPYGLAIASHLDHAGVERVIFGDPLSTWRDHMPKGMLLKSEPFGSDIAAVTAGYRARDFCERNGIDYRERNLPLRVETFLAYAEWYRDHLVPDVRTTVVTSLDHSGGRFRLTTSCGESLAANRVVVATGLMPFITVPGELAGLPTELVSHAWAHSDLQSFRGQRVAVLGAGQSALETAVLLYESGVEVVLLARTPELNWAAPNPDPTGWWSLVKRPITKTGDGWHCWFYHCLPDVFRHLPEDLRVRKGIGFLGPSGAPWLRPRLEGKVPVRLGARIRSAQVARGRIDLELEGAGTEAAGFDHVIAATGYRLDIGRLDFLSPDLSRRIRVAGGAPVLDHHFESGVQGLFFAGAMAAPSLGPSTRFLSGTHLAARRITRAIRGGRRTVASPQEDSAAPLLEEAV